MPIRHLIPLAALLLITACAAPGPTDPQAINDPFEQGNRKVHAFNKALFASVTGDSQDEADESTADQGSAMDVVVNLGSNLSLPGKVLNQILQGRPVPAMRNTARFVVNSTLGLAGLHDPAGREFGLTEIDTDFGETLAVWGVAEGPYLELPLLGPSTSRRAAGRLVDLVISPWNYALPRDGAIAALGVQMVSKAGEKARFSGTMDSVLSESADSYAQARLIYLMYRRHELTQQGGTEDPYVIDPYETVSEGDAYVIDPYEDQ